MTLGVRERNENCRQQAASARRGGGGARAQRDVYIDNTCYTLTSNIAGTIMCATFFVLHEGLGFCHFSRLQRNVSKRMYTLRYAAVSEQEVRHRDPTRTQGRAHAPPCPTEGMRARESQP